MNKIDVDYQVWHTQYYILYLVKNLIYILFFI